MRKERVVKPGREVVPYINYRLPRRRESCLTTYLPPKWQSGSHVAAMVERVAAKMGVGNKQNQTRASASNGHIEAASWSRDATRGVELDARMTVSPLCACILLSSPCVATCRMSCSSSGDPASARRLINSTEFRRIYLGILRCGIAFPRAAFRVVHLHETTHLSAWQWS